MHSVSMTCLGKLTFGVSAAALALTACSGGESDEAKKAPAETAATTTTAATPAAPAEAAPPADNVETMDGTQFASFTGDAAAGETAFATCRTCHAVEAGVNKIGPSLAGIVGRQAGTIAGFSYTPANKNSGITWTPEKLFQYLEKPQRVVPGTKMVFAGIPEAQKRADVIAYLQTN
jgi:cytochrome c